MWENGQVNFQLNDSANKLSNCKAWPGQNSTSILPNNKISGVRGREREREIESISLFFYIDIGSMWLNIALN